MGRTFTILLCLLMFSGLLFAQNSGKIAGMVVDRETDEPLVGANVVIVGQQMGAAVDVDGDFYILNVPPGTYTVEVSMIGYVNKQITNVQVSVGQTTTLEFKVPSTTLETEEIVVVAPRVPVKRDVTQSEVSATEEDMANVPIVQDVYDYMSLQPGITVEGDAEGREMLIRGGGQDQIGMVVDGLTMTNNFDGGPIDIVNLSSVQEVSIIRGGFNAEYGNIRSGLLNVVTKESRKETKGSIDVRYTFPTQKHRGPSLFSQENYFVRPYVDPAVCWVGTQNGDWDEYTQGQYVQFQGWNSFVEGRGDGLTAEQARDLYIWQHRLEGSGALGHPYEGSYGEDPDWNVDLSLNGPVPFINESLGGLRYFVSYRYNLEQYTYPAQLNGVTTNNLLAKLNFDPTPDMKVGLEYVWGKTETAGGAVGGELGREAYYLHVSSPFDTKTQMLGLTFDHVLSPSTFYNIRLNYIQSKNDQNKARVFRDFTTLRSFGPISVDEQPWGWADTTGYIYSIADETVIGGIGGADINLNKIETINIKADMTSQFNKYNEVRFGLEMIFDKFDIFQAFDDQSDPTGNTETIYNKNPFRIQGYVQDKLEFNDFVANLGLRLDYNQNNSAFYGIDPYSKYFTRIFKNELETKAPNEPSEAHFRLSPRLGVAHPITERSKLFFNYGHFYDLGPATPRLEINYGYSSTGIEFLGNPNLKPQRTIAYELGYEQDITDWFLFRLTGYYKDITDQPGDVNYISYDGSVNYFTTENDNYQDIRGFEIELRRDFGTWVTGWLNYTYMVTTSGLIGNQAEYQDPRRQAVEARRNPTEELEKPKPQPYADANLRIMTPPEWGPDWGGIHWFDRFSINMLIRWASGSYELISDPLTQILTQYQYVDSWGFDLRLSKFIRVDRFDFNIFLDIRNVFDYKYLTGGGFVGENDFRDYLISLDGQKLGTYRSSDNPNVNMPNADHLAWNSPRSIILGLRIGF